MSLPPASSLFLLLSIIIIPLVSSNNGHHLTPNYYAHSCPSFSSIVMDNVFTKQSAVPATAAGVLRLFFHDCFTDGCDASLLIRSNAYTKGERDAVPNLSLSGDAFDLISRIKYTLELTCPGVVSCADIISQTTRDLVKMVGGPFYEVPLGRKDSLESNISRPNQTLPDKGMSMDQLIYRFTSKGFSVRDMVALTGAHTIGFTHCKEFSHRIYNFSATSAVDPTMNPKLLAGLQKLCHNYTVDDGIAAFNDVRSPSKFDNSYYQNILNGLGLLTTDYLMSSDPRTRPIVEMYAANQTAFFMDFAAAMHKLSTHQVKTGKRGEVRLRCDQFNTLHM